MFEADLDTGELWKAGRRVKLQSLPFRLLTALLERPGEVVRREELQVRLWGRDTTVDFDHSLGSAVNKIREALGDSADNPRFVETVARHGYRFIAPVGPVAAGPGLRLGDVVVSVPAVVEGALATTAPVMPPTATGAGPEAAVRPHLSQAFTADALPLVPLPLPAEAAAPALEQAPARPHVAWRWMALVGACLLVLGAGLGWLASSLREDARSGPRPVRRLTHGGRISPGAPAMESLPAMATDGVHLFTAVVEGRPMLAEIPVGGGGARPVPMPDEIAAPSLGDISKDGSRLLVRSHLSPEGEQPLWMVTLGSGVAERVGDVQAHDAAWMPDSKGVLYAAGNDLRVWSAGGSRLFVHLPGRAFWLRWSPDGSLLRFTVQDPVTHSWSIWQTAADGRQAVQLLKGWSKPANECCGNWVPEGGGYVFQAGREGHTDLWLLPGTATARPTRLTNGPLEYEAPLPSRDGHTVFFLGVDTESELERWEPGAHQFVPAAAFLSGAHRVEYTRDGKWVAWTDVSGHLWQARADGSEQIQLTPDGLQVFLARWSPDGSRLALMGREAGKPWQVYLLPAGGGQPELLLPEPRNQGDPSWSADGKQLVYGRLPDLMGAETGRRMLRVVNVATRSVEDLPGSEGLLSPRWSPDGRWIAALSADERKLEVAAPGGPWRVLSSDGAQDPVWTSDSQAIFYNGYASAGQPLQRVRIADGRVEAVVKLGELGRTGAVDVFLSGVAPGDVPLVRARTGAADLYALQLKRN